MRKENVTGKAVSTIPYVGYIGYFVRTPIGFILLIIIPASLIIIMEIRNIIREVKKQNKKETSHRKGGKADAGKNLLLLEKSAMSNQFQRQPHKQQGCDSVCEFKVV